MPDRILDFAEEPAYLSVRYDNLVVERPAPAAVVMIPLSDVAVVVASNPQVTFTHAVLAGLAAAGGSFVVCDSLRHPIGMMLPLQGHSTQVERMTSQVGANEPTKKRLWQQIVKLKVYAQAETLLEYREDDAGLVDLSTEVRSGDPDNIEAQAARRYWQCLFGDPEFRRDRVAGDANRFLNYGYAVLRAIVARAICAAGLHPSIGLHHHNRYSGYPLADDLMEPFRVIVDRAVVQLVDRRGQDAPMDKETKGVLVGALTCRFDWAGESRTLFDCVGRVAFSLVEAFSGARRNLEFPSARGFMVPIESAET